LEKKVFSEDERKPAKEQEVQIFYPIPHVLPPPPKADLLQC
jgi:hypothetical protein